MKNNSLIFTFGFISALLVLGCMGFTSKKFDEYKIENIHQSDLNKRIDEMQDKGWTLINLGSSKLLTIDYTTNYLSMGIKPPRGGTYHNILFGK